MIKRFFIAILILSVHFAISTSLLASEPTDSGWSLQYLNYTLEIDYYVLIGEGGFPSSFAIRHFTNGALTNTYELLDLIEPQFLTLLGYPEYDGSAPRAAWIANVSQPNEYSVVITTLAGNDLEIDIRTGTLAPPELPAWRTPLLITALSVLAVLLVARIIIMKIAKKQ